MINAIKFRIEACKRQILHFENSLPSSESEKMLNKGIVVGLQDELDTLNDLLKVAEKLNDLEVSA